MRTLEMETASRVKPPRRAWYLCGALVRTFIAVCTCLLAAVPIGMAAQPAHSKAHRAKAHPAHSETHHTPAPKLRLRGVPQFAEITPTLYRGAQPNKEGFANLRKLGVDIVVDLRGSRD